MRRDPRLLFLFCLLASLMLAPAQAGAAGSKQLLKIASLAPANSVWAKRFDDFAKVVREKSGNEIEFKVYAGGVMGDDRAMYRKMRVGQLQGGGFTMIGISEVVPDFRVLGIPFLFRSYEEVDQVIERLWPRLEQAFDRQNLTLLALSEVGFTYMMSMTPITSVEDLKKTKCWMPAGDPISRTYLETVGVSPIPLNIPDVLTALQTGMVDTVFNSYYGSIVLQWFTGARYITDIPFTYSYGAMVLDKKAFSKLSPPQAALVKEAAKTHFAMMLADTRKSNADSLGILKSNGLTVVKATPESLASLVQSRKEAEAKLIGTVFSKEIYQDTMGLLGELRR